MTKPFARPWLRLILVAAFTLAGLPAFGGAVQVVDPATGEAFSYRPSFAPREAEEPRPQYEVFDPATKRRITIQASREEMAERHRMKFARAQVRFHTSEPAGTLIVDTASRYLYRVNGDGTATRYGIGVGRDGFTWSGVERVARKAEWPDWTPPPEMREREPHLPEWMPGGPENPMGSRALYLGSTLYRIHGTNAAGTIGTAVSSGCIRMLNEDIEHLYGRVSVGTEVVVLGPDSDRRGLMAALSPF